ncbi:hypothetical protein [Streptomyces lusitanus]|uniref:hypothetical protein n=1 Tax=Streptomyces TaxID=1883 RepID=UPI0021C11565|nr:hypothetical protein [Streptomyces lusitanus]
MRRVREAGDPARTRPYAVRSTGRRVRRRAHSGSGAGAAIRRTVVTTVGTVVTVTSP